MVHGHRCYLTENLPGVIWGKTTDERYERTMERQKYIERQGYTVTVKWECEFKNEIETNKELSDFLNRFYRPLDHKLYLDKDTIIHAVKNDLMFGAVELDLHVPDYLKEKFHEFSPIFINGDVSFDMIGQHMQEYVNEFKLSKKPSRLLLGVMKAKKIFVATPLLKWYLEHGLEVTEIYQTVEFDINSTPFKGFVDKVSNARREGDKDPEKAILATTMKLLGNSAYGSTIMRKESHLDVLFSNDPVRISKLINNKNFVNMNELEDDYCEITMKKKKIVMNTPISVGFYILNYGKLRMLQFLYNFVDKYIDRSDYELVQCDTDSFYMALSDENIYNLVKPELRDEFYKDVHNWLPRTDTIENAMFDKRVPGLFKQEMYGHCIVALNSKMYSIHNVDKDESKFSCKGVSKKNFSHPTEMYKSVLQTKETNSGSNTGFRLIKSSIMTYIQRRASFTYYYIKRLLLPDGIHTTCLDIEPTP